MGIRINIKKAYYLLFYKLYCAFKFINDDGWSDLKAITIICCLEVALLIELVVWWTVIFKKGVDLSNPYFIVVPLCLFLAWVNYDIFIEKSHWKIYAREFKRYPPGKKVLTSWLTFFFVMAMIGSLILAFYCMD